MNKFLILLAALGLASTAVAESELNHSAEYRVRGAVSQGANLQTDKSENAIKHRFKLSSEYKANDKVSAQLTLVHNAGWGADDVVFNGRTAISDRSNTNPNNASNNLLNEDTGIIVNEAYATWAINDQFTLKLGRGSFEGGAGTSTALNDFQDVMTAFDGLAAIYDTDFARVIAYLIKFGDFDLDQNYPSPNITSTRHDAEANTIGFSADLKIAPELFEFFNVGVNQVRRDQYTIVLARGANNAVTSSILRPKETYIKYNIGAKINLAEMFFIRGAYSANTGERSRDDGSIDGDIESSMLDVEAGVHLEDNMNFKFSIGFHQDSGDKDPLDDNDDAYNSYYYDVHRYAGLMDVVRWGNLTYWSAKASFEPIENFTVGAGYHIFTATEKAGETNFFGGQSINNTTVTKNTAGTPLAGIETDKDDIGSEIDVYASHVYDNGLTLTARYGLFMVGDRMKDYFKKTAAIASVPGLAGFALDEAEDYQTFFLEGTFRF